MTNNKLLKTVTKIGFMLITSHAAAQAHGPSLKQQIGCVIPGAPHQYYDRDELVEQTTRLSWSPIHFSDPQHHNPNQYRYIVHAIDGFGYRFSADSSFEYVNIKIAENPCATLSTSIIDEQKHFTFGQLGFIISVPSENILFATSGDMGTEHLALNTDAARFNASMKSLRTQVGPLIPREKVLRESKVDWSNEVLVQGKVQNSISIVGVFIRPYADPRLLAEIIQVAKSHNLPIVELPARMPGQ